MLTAIAIIIILIVALLAYGATRPANFRVQRTASIKAPPAKIFPFISDLHRWGAWSPFEKCDPAMKRSFGAAADGKGAVYAWDGNRRAGAGRMEITDTSPPSKIIIKLDFTRPIEGHNIAEFTLEPKGDETNVTWAMHGPTAFIAKVMSLFCSMDKMIGKEFETGLAELKRIAENQA